MEERQRAMEARWAVERHFEPHRLQRDLEAQAYQHLVPILSRPLSKQATGPGPGDYTDQALKEVAS